MSMLFALTPSSSAAAAPALLNPDVASAPTMAMKTTEVSSRVLTLRISSPPVVRFEVEHERYGAGGAVVVVTVDAAMSLPVQGVAAGFPFGPKSTNLPFFTCMYQPQLVGAAWP